MLREATNGDCVLQFQDPLCFGCSSSAPGLVADIPYAPRVGYPDSVFSASGRVSEKTWIPGFDIEARNVLEKTSSVAERHPPWQ